MILLKNPKWIICHQKFRTSMSSSFQVLFRVQTPKHHWLYCNKPTLTDTVSLEVWRRLSATTELTSDYHIEESGLLTRTTSSKSASLAIFGSSIFSTSGPTSGNGRKKQLLWLETAKSTKRVQKARAASTQKWESGMNQIPEHEQMHPFSEAVSTAAGKKEVKEKPQPMALKSEPTQKESESLEAESYLDWSGEMESQLIRNSW